MFQSYNDMAVIFILMYNGVNTKLHRQDLMQPLSNIAVCGTTFNI